MKKFLVALALLMVTKVSYAHSYEVSGVDDYGRYLDGDVESNGSRYVSGELSDAYGNSYEFEGEWDGYGTINGETDDGAIVELDVG